MSHRFIVACSVLALFAGLSAGLAKADSLNATSPAVVSSGEYDFTYVVGSNTYAWSIPEPVAAMGVVSGASFAFDGIPFTLNQGPSMLGDVEFFSDSFFGGFALATYPPGAGQTYFANTGGPVLYTGPESSPTFDLGTFSVEDVTAGTTGAITISEVNATATPEPSTLLLTGLGVVALFWVARKRRFVTPV
ncbi:MAG TPA: PEP-CTERM sorting domain-containing protein [Candidatus Acidoferrales bacterium]|nr:PEP-CTERM sorting domain-containing protein [Candidatus Acidoferrales bacterium]